jgi:PAS domain S-box-containing protein
MSFWHLIGIGQDAEQGTMMNIYAVLALLSIVASLSLGLYIFFSNPREKQNRLYTLVSLSLAFWSYTYFLLFTAQSLQTYLIADKLSTAGTSLVAIFLLHFYLRFTKRMPGMLALISLYLVQIIFVILDYTTQLIVVSATVVPGGYEMIRGPLYLPYTGIVAIYVLIGLFLLFRFHREVKSPREKNQVKLVMVASGIPLVFAIVFEVLPPVFGLHDILVTPLVSSITGFCIGYAMLRYGLMTITQEMAAENIVETMSDYLIVADDQGNIALANRACLDALGYTRDEVKGLHLSVFFPQEKALLEKIDRAEALKDYETLVSLKDKQTVPVSIDGSPMKNKLGGIIGYVLVMRDIRETKRLIQGLEEKKNELEHSREEIEKSAKALKIKVDELEQFNKIAVDRELQMVELKNRISELEQKK